MKNRNVYVIGSLRNPKVPDVAIAIRAAGFDAFDDWYAAGPEADDFWQKYEQEHRKHSLQEALRGNPANHVFLYDRTHLNLADIGVLVLPTGRSGHMELGYLLGQGKPGYILYEKEPERWDVMYRFANEVFFDVNQLCRTLQENHL